MGTFPSCLSVREATCLNAWKGFRLGAVDFVTRPFQREELLAPVRTHLEFGRLRDHFKNEVAERTAELHKSEERSRMMANSVPVLIWKSGPDNL